MNFHKTLIDRAATTSPLRLLSTAMLIGGGAISEANAQEEMFRSTAKFPFEIMECTKGEQMAVGSDKNVLRWKKEGTGFKGAWYLKDAGGGKVNIVHKKTGQHLTVQGLTGNVHVADARAKDKEQLFKIDVLTKDQAQKILPKAVFDKASALDSFGVRFVRITESTRGERVAVGSNGNILRWGKTNDQTQVFVFWIQTA